MWGLVGQEFMGKETVTTKKGDILPKALGVMLLLCTGALFDSGLAYFSKEGGGLLLVQMDAMESLRRNWISYGLYFAGMCWFFVEVILVVKNAVHTGKISPDE